MFQRLLVCERRTRCTPRPLHEPLLLRLHGSPFPRSLPFAALSVALTLLLKLQDGWGDRVKTTLEHHYSFQVYAFVIGFLVVLRTNHALSRFMEARANVEQMASKWRGTEGNEPRNPQRRSASVYERSLPLERGRMLHDVAIDNRVALIDVVHAPYREG